MSELDLSPAAAAAPRPQRVARHAWIEAKLVLRNGEQLLLALVIPIGLIVAQSAFGARFGIEVNGFVAAVIALGLWSTGFTSLAILTAFERRYGVLERLVATPLRPLDLLLGKALAMTGLALAQAVVLAVAGLLTGWAPRPAALQTVVVVVTAPLALLAFAALGLALSGRGSAELTLGLANLIYLVGAAAGLLIPPDAFPVWSRPVLDALPTTALAEALRAWAAGSVVAWPIPVVLAWAIAANLLAGKVFRWTS